MQQIKEEILKFPKKVPNNPPEINEFESTSNCFIFYYLDVVQYYAARPGLLYLFGKTYDATSRSYKNCCVNIKYCHQRLYFLPRQNFIYEPDKKVTFKDVFIEVCEKIIPKLETQEVEFHKVRKKYAFSDYIPEEADYLEIKCNVGNCFLSDVFGETFTNILGNKRHTFVETFLVERNIKGPCWLKVENYQEIPKNRTIECYNINDIIALDIDSIPPLKLLGLEIKKVSREDAKTEEIVSVGCVVEVQHMLAKETVTLSLDHFCIFSNGISKCEKNILKQLDNYSHTNVIRVDSEEKLIYLLIQKISDYDPDIVYGHSMLSHQIQLLYSKILRYNIPKEQVNKLSRIKHAKIPLVHFKTDLFAGRIVCDTKSLAEDMIKSRTYSLHELAKEYLQVSHVYLTAEMLNACLKDPDRLLDLILITVWDVMCVHYLMQKLNILQLIFEITKLCGNTLNNTCECIPSNRCEYLLMHAFHQKNFILPQKWTRNVKDVSVNIQGGLVLEPETGLHQNFVLAMDFRALYPSIIREFNVCHTTLKLNEDDEMVVIDREGVLPQLVADLIDHRERILQEIASLNNTASKSYLDHLRIKQGIIKRIANSIFGTLGFKSSRFLAEHLANFITRKGREILSDTVSTLENFPAIKVIYGDTDSVMVETNLESYQEVVELSKTLIEAINSKYKHVVIENAGIYKPFYILRKKKYAGIRFKSAERTEEEIKGLDVVRKDWAEIASVVGKHVLTMILNDTNNMDVWIYNYLQDICQDIEQNYEKYDVQSFAINKKLNKDPDKYSNRSVEHVRIALKYNETHADKMKEGDIVSYVVCIDGSARSPLERAYHVDEFIKSNYLKIDVNYYLSQQIYPVVKRICLPLSTSISGRELLIALKVNLRKNQANTESGRVTKKAKIEKPEPKLDPSANFLLKCKKCDKEKLVAYASLDFIKSCDINCEDFNIQHFHTRLINITGNLRLSYIDKDVKSERTFLEIYKVIINIRNAVENIQRTSNELASYLSVIDSVREEILKDVNCWNFDMNEVFRLAENVKF